MATTLTWFASIVDDKNAAVANLKVDLELFETAKAAWTALQTLSSDASGKLAGKASIPADSLPYAPALRLVESGASAVLATPLQLSASARAPQLSADFGQITRLPVKSRIILRPVSLPGGDITLGGSNTKLATEAAVDLEKVRLEVRAELRQELTKSIGLELEQQYDGLKASLQKQEALISERNQALAERDTRISQLALDKQRLERDLAEALKNGAAADPVPVSVPVSVTSFASKIGQDLATVQRSLAEEKQAFTLGRIEIKARGVLSGNGDKIEFIGKDSVLQADRLSDLILQFEPKEQLSSDLDVKVPDVVQLTEAAARRVLASVGLVLQPSYGPRSIKPDSAPGQAMRQTPSAGETASRGARILVVFADVEGKQP